MAMTSPIQARLAARRTCVEEGTCLAGAKPVPGSSRSFGFFTNVATFLGMRPCCFCVS